MTHMNMDVTIRGGRVSSSRHRFASQISADFTGLEEGVNRYDLLLLVKRVGKVAGFSARMIELLDYYMAYTRDIDWEEGANPIVYQSQARTALDLNISERQLQRIEQDLFKAGAISWHDSGNHKRYGQRDAETGRILYAYGVDLTPLAYLRAELEQKLQEKKLYDAAWLETKRQISYYRAQIRSILAELTELPTQANHASAQVLAKDYEQIAIRIRTNMDLTGLRSLCAQHQALYKQASDLIVQEDLTDKNSLMSDEMSSTHDNNDRHIQYTTYKKSNKLDNSSTTSNRFQKTSKKSSSDQTNHTPSQINSANSKDTNHDLILETGLQHITLKQVLNICSDEARAHIPIESRAMNWRDIVEAAYKLRSMHSISQNSWGRACLTLGQNGAAICVILTDQATRRADDAVRKPAAYFNAMISRAEKGELKLHQSVFGLLKS